MAADWISSGARREAGERADRHVERLTRSATAADIGRRSAQEELDDVADALEQLMPDLDRGQARRGGKDRGEATQPANRRDRRAAASRARETTDHSRSDLARPGDARTGRIEAVLKALDRLDRRVDDLSRSPKDSDNDPHEYGRENRTRPATAIRSGHSLPPKASMPQPRMRAATSDDGFGEDHAADRYAAAAYGADPHGSNEMRPFLRELSAKIDRLNAPQNQGYADLRREIDSLRNALENRSREGFGERNEREVLRLVEAVESLRASRVDARLVQALRDEIADLRGSLNHSNVEGLLQSLESGYVHLVERLDDLGRGAVDPAILQGVGQRLAEIEDGFRILPRAEQILALEDRVSDIGHKVEEIARRGSGRGLEDLGEELHGLRALVEKFDVRHLVIDLNDRLRDVALRLDDIDILVAEQRGFADRLSGMESRMVDAHAVDRLQVRLEEITAMLAEDRNRGRIDDPDHLDARFDDIVGRLDRIEGSKAAPRSYDAAFTLLEKRLTAIDGKIDALDRVEVRSSAGGNEAFADSDVIGRLEAGIIRLNERLDHGNPDGASDVSSLRSEIAALRESLDAQPSVTDLEARLRDLTEALSGSEEIPGAGGDEKLLGLIEEKVAGLAAQIDAAESRLASLGTNAATSGGVNLSDTVNDAISSALRKDLEKLLRSAKQSEQIQTVEEVQNLLAAINARLAGLEGTQGPVSSLQPPAKQTPALDGDLPLEPGSGKPQELPVRASSASVPSRDVGRQVAHTPQEEARNRKADFIAAARRAAQAAAAEVAGQGASELDAPRSESRKAITTSKAGWLRERLGKGREGEADTVAADDRQVQSRKAIRAEIAASMANLRADRRPAETPEVETPVKAAAKGGTPSSSRRRALLLAAAAIVLAIGTLQAFRLISKPDEDLAALDKPVAAIEQSVGPNTSAEPASIVNSLNDPAALPEAIVEPGQPLGETPPALTRKETATANPHAPASSDDLAFAPPAGVQNTFEPAGSLPPSGHFSATGKAGSENASSSVKADALPEEVGPLALRQAAAGGNPSALFEIAVRYSDGVGVKPDLTQAVKYYEKAAASGLAPAQYRLGSLFEKGQGVAKDLEAAQLWYTRAASQGNAKATHNLAVLYAEGINGEPEFPKAAEWFERSAGFGVRDSQYNLGILYARGLGVEKNLVDSYKWFALAARQGDADAAKKRDEVANILEKAHLAAARLAVDTWKQTPLERAANEVEVNPSWTTDEDTLSKANLVSEPSDLVLNVQKLLGRLGYDAGSADGQFGPKTRDAVISFQKEAGLPATGKIDKELLKALLGRSI